MAGPISPMRPLCPISDSNDLAARRIAVVWIRFVWTHFRVSCKSRLDPEKSLKFNGHSPDVSAPRLHVYAVPVVIVFPR